MTESMDMQPPSDAELDKLRLIGICHEVLNFEVPNKVEKAIKAKQAFQNAMEAAGLSDQVDSNIYISRDSLTDNIKSYKVRLVPRELKRGYQFFDEGEIRALVINVPFVFMKDPEQIDGIEVCLVSFEVVTIDGINTVRYALTESGFSPFEDFSTLDFIYNKEIGNQQHDYVTQVVSTEDDGTFAITDTTQLHIAETLYVVLHEYVLGNQSRKHGTL